MAVRGRLPVTNARSAGVSGLFRRGYVGRVFEASGGRNSWITPEKQDASTAFSGPHRQKGGVTVNETESKRRYHVWLYPSTKEQVESFFRMDNCKSQSEFIEKAIRFYLGYIASGKTNAYMPAATAAVMEGLLTGFEDRVSKLLFKQAVEEAMMMNIIACDTDIDQEQINSLRGKCVADVKRTNGQISFRDILKYQKTL